MNDIIIVVFISLFMEFVAVFRFDYKFSCYEFFTLFINSSLSAPRSQVISMCVACARNMTKEFHSFFLHFYTQRLSGFPFNYTFYVRYRCHSSLPSFSWSVGWLNPNNFFTISFSGLNSLQNLRLIDAGS